MSPLCYIYICIYLFIYVVSMDNSKFHQCVLCSKRTKPKDRRPLAGPNNKDIRQYLSRSFMLNVTGENVICGKCRIQCYKGKQFTSKLKNSASQGNDPVYIPTEKKATEGSIQSPRNITLPLSSVSGSSHSSCCVCKKRDCKFITVPTNVRYLTLIDQNIIIPAGSRCCPCHISEGKFNDLSIGKMKDIRGVSEFNRTELHNLIQHIRDMALKNKEKRVDFDTPDSMTDTDYINIIGLNKADLEDICSHIKDLRNTKVRSMRTCIALLLSKLKSGMSNQLLSTVYNIPKKSIRRAIASARKALAKDFTPRYIGFQHISREDIITQHTRPLANTLFGGKTCAPAILVIDGTYIYIQKSMKFRFQRRSYSMHKHRPLVKPMMFVSTTGYIVSVIGPYFSDAKNNDANILKHVMFRNEEEIRSWVKEDDVFVVDRGFRDSLSMLERLGIRSEMPSFLKKGQAQHSPEESNTSRLVTKIRWVVESVNGRIKTWKYLNNIVPNSQIPHIEDDIKLISAICNKYMKPLVSTNEESETLLGCKMLVLAKQNNKLMERVIANGWDKMRTQWKKINEDSFFFPSLDEEELRNLTLGVYQLKLAKSYTEEHLNPDGEYEVLICGIQEGLLMGKIQSRHVSNKVYKLWIEFNEFSVLGWYCQCRTGARVVGTCAHISSVIWYLGFARHQNIAFKSDTDWSKYLKDAKDTPEPQLLENSSDEEVLEE